MPEIIIPLAFRRTLKRKERQMQDAVARCVELLGDNPRHPGLQCHRMQGFPGVWEAYVDRANRVTYHYDQDGAIVLRKNCNHDVLRHP